MFVVGSLQELAGQDIADTLQLSLEELELEGSCFHLP